MRLVSCTQSNAKGELARFSACDASDQSTRRFWRPGLLFPLAILLLSPLLAVVLGGLSPAQAQDDAEAGAAVFAVNCASCHQAGGIGLPGTFPPLKGNEHAADADYVADVIVNGRTGALEVDGVSYDSVMPPISLSDGDRDAVVAYVNSIAEASSAQADEADEVAAPIVGSPENGRDLFTGSQGLTNGASACVACHTAGSVDRFGGPGLGPDLTNAVDTLGGEAGLAGWLANPPAATMAPIFSDHPMTETEVADLAAFLNEAKAEGSSGPSFDWFSLAGLAGLAVLLGGMSIFWRGMRQTYVERLRSKK